METKVHHTPLKDNSSNLMYGFVAQFGCGNTEKTLIPFFAIFHNSKSRNKKKRHAEKFFSLLSDKKPFRFT